MEKVMQEETINVNENVNSNEEIYEPDSEETKEDTVNIGGTSLTINLDSPIEVLRKQATMIADSGIAGTNNPEAIMIMWLTGKELGFKPMASLTNIFVVNDRPALNKHIINALLQKEGWVASLVENFVKVEGVNDHRTTYEFRNVKKLKEVVAMKMELAKQKDVSDEIKASILKDLDEISKAYIQRYSFTHSQAYRMKLLEKSTWQNMTEIMMQSRALVLGARQVAPRALMGMPEISEIADVQNVPYGLDEAGNVLIHRDRDHY